MSRTETQAVRTVKNLIAQAETCADLAIDAQGTADAADLLADTRRAIVRALTAVDHYFTAMDSRWYDFGEAIDAVELRLQEEGLHLPE